MKPLDSTTMQRIMKEVTLDLKPPEQESPEESAFRKQVTKEIKDIKERGLIVDFTPEMPFVD